MLMEKKSVSYWKIGILLVALNILFSTGIALSPKKLRECNFPVRFSVTILFYCLAEQMVFPCIVMYFIHKNDNWKPLTVRQHNNSLSKLRPINELASVVIMKHAHGKHMWVDWLNWNFSHIKRNCFHSKLSYGMFIFRYWVQITTVIYYVLLQPILP